MTKSELIWYVCVYTTMAIMIIILMMMDKMTCAFDERIQFVPTYVNETRDSEKRERLLRLELKFAFIILFGHLF